MAAGYVLDFSTDVKDFAAIKYTSSGAVDTTFGAIAALCPKCGAESPLSGVSAPNFGSIPGFKDLEDRADEHPGGHAPTRNRNEGSRTR